MHLLVGLGNPGENFECTRHNIGFRIIDAIRSKCAAVWEKKAFSGSLSAIKMEQIESLTLQPQTFMNNSGRSVAAAAAFYKIPSTQVIVFHDELDLELSLVKVKAGGSANGHKGVQSVIDSMGKNFIRVRFGIDRPTLKGEVSHYVLEKFSPEEMEKVDHTIGLIAKNLDLILSDPNLFSKEVNNHGI